jgi:GT2 family glycosyltransferase
VSVDVEISIVSTNNRELLRRCLDSLAAGCGSLTWRASVVDNGSDDGTAELLAADYPSVTAIRNETRQGISANHNKVLGPALERGELRYFLTAHEDVELQPGAVELLVAFCERSPRLGAVGPVVVSEDGRPERGLRGYPTLARELHNSLRPRRTASLPPRTVGYVDAACTLFRAEALREIGLLDERFFGFYEDVDVGLRLRAAGWESAICEEATVVHHRHGTWVRPGLRAEAQRMRSRYLFFRKHHGPLQAQTVAVLGRAILVLRAGKAVAAGVLRRERTEIEHGRWLLSLARHRPDRPLQHEQAYGAR